MKSLGIKQPKKGNVRRGWRSGHAILVSGDTLRWRKQEYKGIRAEQKTLWAGKWYPVL